MGTGKLLGRVPTSQGTALFAQGGRGLLACGGTGGELTLRDPRHGLRAEATLAAHSGSVVALDCRGDLIVSSGLGRSTRGLGGLALESTVKACGQPSPAPHARFFSIISGNHLCSTGLRRPRCAADPRAHSVPVGAADSALPTPLLLYPAGACPAQPLRLSDRRLCAGQDCQPDCTKSVALCTLHRWPLLAASRSWT